MERREVLLDLLSKSVWTYQDIMKYDSNIKSKPTAIKMKNRAIAEFDGGVAYGLKYAKTDSVLKCYGTTRDEEIKRLRELNEIDLQKRNI